jgi:hypothetical protein
VAVQNKVFDRLRHRHAFLAARRPGTESDLDAFRGARQCLVVTFKRSGEPIPSPVNFGMSDDGKLYFRSESDAAKLTRIRNNPHVRVCPCSLRGKPRGPSTEATARLLDATETPRAHAILSANWDAMSKIVEGTLDRAGVVSIYVEVTPAAGSG